MAFQRQQFQSSLRLDLYVFGISGPWRMGSASKLIQIWNLRVFAPPLIIMYTLIINRLATLLGHLKIVIYELCKSYIFAILVCLNTQCSNPHLKDWRYLWKEYMLTVCSNDLFNKSVVDVSNDIVEQHVKMSWTTRWDLSEIRGPLLRTAMMFL